MNKIAVSTLVWKRPEIFRMFCENFSNLNPKPIILIAGSENDRCALIAREYECEYVLAPNIKLGRKANRSVELARELDVDYIMLTGSDDLMSQSLWDYYVNFKGEVLGLKDLYFYDMPTGKTLHWKGYSKNSSRFGEPIGACKMIRKDILEKLDYKPFDERTPSACEGSTHKKLKALGVVQTVVTMQEAGGVAVDIKNEASYTKFKQWLNSEFVTFNESIGKDGYLSELILGGKNQF